MTERISDAAAAVDEQKRKARRRLVGAVVLALAAAVILPLLLEKEPQPLGEDVSVQIPPIDEGKFVNRLTRKPADAPFPKQEAKAATPPKSEPEKAPVPTAPADTSQSAADAPVPGGSAGKSVADAEQRVLAAVSTKSAPPADATAQSTPSVAPKGVPAVTRPEANAAQKAMPAAPKPDATPTPGAGAAAGFAIQLAAFSDDKGANSYANKLKKAGYESAYVEATDSSHGTLWRVRVGGFATRADAEAARVKLKSEGYNGMISPVR